MRRTLTRLGLATAVLTATIGFSGGVANAVPVAAAQTAQQLAAQQWVYMGSYGRYEWCRQQLQYYWPAFDAQCVYNGYSGNYDLYVLL